MRLVCQTIESIITGEYRMVKPGSKDHKASILINGLELDELQRFDWMMAESFGLDRRIADYQRHTSHRVVALGYRMPGGSD